MAEDTAGNGSPRVLNGWKEIAAYLGKSVRSVQRWEATLGMPVHRIHTADGVIVYAEPEEIGEWRRQLDAPAVSESEDLSDPEPPAAAAPEPTRAAPAGQAARDRWRTWQLAACGLALFLGGAAGGWWSKRPSNAAVEIRYVGRTIEAIGRDGTLAWTYRFDGDVNSPRRGPTFIDLDGDGETEILVPVHNTAQGAGAAVSDALFCFTRYGKLKWKVAPDQAFSFNGRSYGAPWTLRDFAVSMTAEPRRVWVAFAHHTWFPGFVLEIDAQGTSRLKYVQSGALYSVAHWMTPAGGFLAVGGTSEEHAQATVALLPDGPSAATFPTEGKRHVACDDCPEGTPSRILLVAAAELTAASRELFPYVFVLRAVGATMRATIRDGPGTSVAVVNPDFSIDSIQFGQHYWGAHHDLEVKGLLMHGASRCPDRHRPREVKEWTPGDGWRVFAVAPETEDVHAES